MQSGNAGPGGRPRPCSSRSPYLRAMPPRSCSSAITCTKPPPPRIALRTLGADRECRDRLPCGKLDLRKLGMQLPDLMLAPDRRAEPVMCDRRNHEESSLGRVEGAVQPVCTLHVGPSPRQFARVGRPLAFSSFILSGNRAAIVPASAPLSVGRTGISAYSLAGIGVRRRGQGRGSCRSSRVAVSVLLRKLPAVRRGDLVDGGGPP